MTELLKNITIQNLVDYSSKFGRKYSEWYRKNSFNKSFRII